MLGSIQGDYVLTCFDYGQLFNFRLNIPYGDIALYVNASLNMLFDQYGISKDFVDKERLEPLVNDFFYLLLHF